MLPEVAFKSTGMLGLVFRRQCPHKFVCLIQTRCDSTLAAPKKVRGTTALTKLKPKDIEAQMQNWETAHNTFYGPERDYKNFPHPVMGETNPEVYFKCIPKTWFDALYAKTGVTGPFLLTGGIVTALFSKELIVYDLHFREFISFWLMVSFWSWKLGPKFMNFLNKKQDEVYEYNYGAPLRKVKEKTQIVIDSVTKNIWQEEGKAELWKAHKDNVGLQLEAIYRNRLQDVHDEVKKRLNYQVDVLNAKRQFEQQHMVNWIVDSVSKGITPQQEKASLNKCILDLKSLAQA